MPVSQLHTSQQPDIPRSFNDSTNSQPRALLRDAPIAEDEQASESAMASTLARLREQGPTRRSSTLRGRRDARNTMIIPSQQAPVAEEPRPRSAEPPQAANAAAPTTSMIPPLYNTPFISSLHQNQPSDSSTNLATRPSIGDDHATSDAGSIRSGRSNSTMNHTIQHPNLTGPGLNASIIETVSAWQEAGAVTRAVVIGELALAHNINLSDPSSPSAGTTNDTIRLENFSALEKVAPNPTFVSQITTDKAGEYTIDLSSISRASVAFKYQVSITPAILSAQAPMLLTPAWKIEPTQSSVILTYAANPALKAPVTLTNVLLAVHLDGGRASSCLSKPSGTFSKERNMIYWRLDELTLTPGAPAQKLLARFQTEGEGKAGRVEARWEMRADGAGMGSGISSGLGSGLSVSRLDAPAADPFADSAEVQGTWRDVGTVRRVVSGTYEAV